MNRVSTSPVSALRWLARCAGDESGVFAIKLAAMLPIMFAITGLGIDHARHIREKVNLQRAADAAAMAAAKEMSLTDTRESSLPAIAESVVARQLAIREQVDGKPKPQVTTSVKRDPLEVTVLATRPFETAFVKMFGFELPPVTATATARIVGKPNICVLGLNPQESGTISLEQQARVTGQNCAVYSNSAHNNGLKSKNSAQLSATFICTRGGLDGDHGSFNPEPIVDCPEFHDPLADRPEPLAGPCDPSKPTVITADRTLDPGTYCGLEILNGARVTLRDGIYSIKNKPLVVKDGGGLFGEAAGLHFVGADAAIDFDRNSTISLKAPTSGPMAGLLVFASRTQAKSLAHRIESNDARVLIGTIYIPNGELRIDATNPIADQSAYTAIVADTIRLYGGPHLILNTDYSSTPVPVPDGIKGVGQPVVLAE